jgi:hypothetical protein
MVRAYPAVTTTISRVVVALPDARTNAKPTVAAMTTPVSSLPIPLPCSGCNNAVMAPAATAEPIYAATMRAKSAAGGLSVPATRYTAMAHTENTPPKSEA